MLPDRVNCDKCKTYSAGETLRFRLNNYKKDISDSTFDLPGLTFKHVSICDYCVNKERREKLLFGAVGLFILTTIILLAWNYLDSQIGSIIVFSSFIFIVMVLNGIFKYVIMTNKTKKIVREQLAKASLSKTAESFGEGFYYETF